MSKTYKNKESNTSKKNKGRKRQDSDFKFDKRAYNNIRLSDLPKIEEYSRDN